MDATNDPAIISEIQTQSNKQYAILRAEDGKSQPSEFTTAPLMLEYIREQ